MKTVTGSSISGHLKIRCDIRDGSVPYLSEQSFRAPMHLSKSHLSNGSLVVTLVNPTAGFFDGDLLQCEVVVGEGANLVLSTPSSSRVFSTRSGGAAECLQKFRVEENGFLEWIPEAFIPHKGASYRQRTEIELERGAGLFFVDWIAPGRVARGEAFVYEKLRWELDLYVSGQLVARERYDVLGKNGGPEGIVGMFEAGHYLSLFVAGEMINDWPEAELHALSGPDAYVGFGQLEGGVMAIRAICRDSISARECVSAMRELFYSRVERKVPALGRIFL